LDKATAYRDLADFLRFEGIASCVLHGVDPQSGVIGRDLDLYLPNPRQAYRTAVQFSEILRRRGVQWVSLMHPIWGPRCIGVQQPGLDYWELHLHTRINMACIDFGEVFPIGGVEGVHGFRFDPVFWFIKAVVQKYASRFVHGRPVWAHATGDAYALAHKTAIEEEFQSSWAHGAEFVSAALGPDTDRNLRVRRNGLFSLMARFCLAHPWSAARTIARWQCRKADVFRCPTTPVVGVDTTMESSALRKLLKEKLGHVFTKIVVADRPVSWHERKRLQATQSLLVFTRNEQGGDPGHIDNWISISPANRDDTDAGLATILDSVVQYNARWSSIYRARSTRSGR
jgi:hypothetical protein